MRKKGGLGKGLAALIPAGPTMGDEMASVSRETEVETIPVQGPPRVEPAPEYAENEDLEEAFDHVPFEESEEEFEAEPDVAELAPVPGASFQLVRLDQIDVNPKQPRQVFEEEALEELKTSLSEVGLLQPIAVREHETGYELIMGERRTRAARELGWETIPAIVREAPEESLLRDALLENIHRVQLNPLEEGAAYQQLLDEFEVTQEELSKRIGRSRPQISNMIRLLNLPGPVQRRVAAGVLSAGHARALLRLPTGGEQIDLAARIVNEGLSVRAVEEIVLLSVSDAEAVEPEVSRETAPKRTSAARAPGLSELADRLGEHFDTQVSVKLGKKKGRVVIEFGSVSDLERIATQMGLAAKD